MKPLSRWWAVPWVHDPFVVTLVGLLAVVQVVCVARGGHPVPMRSRLAAAAAAVVASVLLSAACSSEDPVAISDPVPYPGTGKTLPPEPWPAIEGPAAGYARWPDGVWAKLDDVERVPNSWGVDVPSSMAIVRMTLIVINFSDVLLPVVPGSKELTLLYGPDRRECGPVTGRVYTHPVDVSTRSLDVDGGTQIAKGGTAKFVESALVPVAELGSLMVRVEMPSADGIREPFTLTEVEKLLKTVN